MMMMLDPEERIQRLRTEIARLQRIASGSGYHALPPADMPSAAANCNSRIEVPAPAAAFLQGTWKRAVLGLSWRPAPRLRGSRRQRRRIIQVAPGTQPVGPGGTYRVPWIVQSLGAPIIVKVFAFLIEGCPRTRRVTEHERLVAGMLIYPGA